MLPFRVQFRDGMPVSDQLSLAVRRAVLAGELRDGEAFPSVRMLAQELKISPATIHKVVAALREDGFLAVRPGIESGDGAAGVRQRWPGGSVGALGPVCGALLPEAVLFHAPLPEVLEVPEAVRLAAVRGGISEIYLCRFPAAQGSSVPDSAVPATGIDGTPCRFEMTFLTATVNAVTMRDPL